MGASRIDTSRFMLRLTAERASLAADVPRVGQLAELFPRSEVVDPEDLSVHLTERDVALDMIDRRASRLMLIDAALARLGDGTYGDCSTCGEPIASARLEADPAVELCIGCQQRLEDTQSLRYPEM